MVKDTIAWMFKDKDALRRLLFTVGMLIVVRLLYLIPLPGVDSGAFYEFIKSAMTSKGTPRYGLLGGPFSNFTIFSLGLMPFISACILLQIASLIIPPLRRFSFGGERGRDAVLKLTYAVTIAISILQSYYTISWLERLNVPGGNNIVVIHGLIFKLVIVFSMTAAVFFLIYITGLITRYGIGNGVVMIIVSSFIFRIVAGIESAYDQINRSICLGDFILLITFWAVLAWGIYYVTRRGRILNINGPNSAVIELKASYLGTAPVACASAIIGLTYLLFSFSPILHVNFIWKYNLILTILLIFVFTFSYIYLVFDSKHVRSLLDRHGYSFTDAQKDPEGYLDANLSRVLLVTSAILIVMEVIPEILKSRYQVLFQFHGLYSASFILVGVGVFSDLIQQVRFLKMKKESGIKEWGICYIAFDEIEATIKSEFLKSRQIKALVEPLRFTWGMPIRTAMDQYRIYVPSAKKDEARGLIL